ncbi:MAG: Hsp70 family protein [Candidatus Pacebacteria bacterium]|nr:Hsp70 family protein [Candidatus Paceibacterota bacterium]
MATRHIQIGIDLGTTNSEVAINNGSSVEIIKNGFNDEYTPSVFGIDKSKNKIVGKKAYERLFKYASKEELANNKAEVKRIMGTAETVRFERTDEDLKPEEISAEILKSLKEDILRKYPEFNTTSAVITIPAHFSVVQAEATKRAGNISGFDYVVLLQEPIAAAIGYGFMNAKNENWLVYDLGGGTFDVALISAKDGHLTVVAQNGDNFLGGKDFDKLIIEKVLIPKIKEEFNCPDIKEDKVIFSKLKNLAEVAKIELTSYDKTNIQIENIGEDADGKEIYLSIDFSRSEFEKLIKPLVDRTIKLSQETIKESGIKQTSVDKIILVGGPTLIPYVKNRLESDLKIQVDASVDPLTIVARGACIYGVSQQVPDEFAKKVVQNKDAMNLKLHFDSLSSDVETTVSGIVEELRDSEEDHYLQIQGDSGTYSGPKVKIKNGKFFDTITLDANRTNLFWIYLFDAQGNAVPIEPDSFTIIHGLSISGAPIPHAIGVGVVKKDFKTGLATEIFDKYFAKNSVLPLKETRTFKTLRKLKKGDKENVLPINVYEGESDRQDRNQRVCSLKISGEKIPYDLPEGTPIEITIEINESREVSVNAYIESIDLSLDARASIHAEDLNVEQMKEELGSQRARIDNAKENCSPEERKSLEHTYDSVDNSLDRAEDDQDEKRKANKQLKDLKLQLDMIERDKEMPQLIREFKEGVQKAAEAIKEVGNKEELNQHKELLDSLKTEGEMAIEDEDKHLLIRVNEQIDDLKHKIIFSNPAAWAYFFEKIVKDNKKFISDKEAEYYINKGRRAIEMGDTEELKRCVKGLMLLLPPEEQAMLQNTMSGITY